MDRAAYERAVIDNQNSIIVRMAKATKWLQAILDYMKKVKSITSTVHTHPPNGRGGANQRPRKIAITGALYSEASGRMGGPKVIKINYLTSN